MAISQHAKTPGPSPSANHRQRRHPELTRGGDNGSGRRRYATIEQAAEYIAVNPATIRAMQADGRLTRYQLGPRIDPAR